MAVQYTGQPVEILQWDGKTVMYGASTAKISISCDGDYNKYEDTITFSFETIKGNPAAVNIMAVRTYGQLGVSTNTENKTFTISSISKTATFKQKHGAGKYDDFSTLDIKEIKNAATGEVLWTPHINKPRATFTSFAILSL